jgi:anaerobic magnesium-protoporphyrin IX monomethyl ester cyclase
MNPLLKNNIMLIEPPFYRLYKDSFSLTLYPLSLGYLAGAIKKETDWEVSVFNADFSPKNEPLSIAFLVGEGFDNYLKNLNNIEAPLWQELRSVIRNKRPSVVGISSKTQNFGATRVVARICKEIDSQIKVVVGGPHPSMVRHKVLECPDIDFAVYGEGERTIIELLQVLTGKRSLKDVHGIIYRVNGEIRETPPQKYISDLNTLTFPHETAADALINYEQYPPYAFDSIFATRGCPFNCFFCGSRNIWSRRVRFRSPANVSAEIRKLMARGLRSVHFSDDTFGTNKKYLIELCNTLIKDCPGLKWGCEIHAKLVNDQIIKLMKTAGCYRITIGIESGNNYILNKIRKGFTIEEAFEAVKIIKRYKIDIGAFFMVGFPFETADMLNDTIQAIKKVKCDWIYYSIFTPYPGTEAFEYCLKHGIISEDYDYSLYNHQSPLNYFSLHMSRETFRKLCKVTEHAVDRKNYFGRLRRVASLNNLWQIQELGFKELLKRGLQIVFKKTY